MGIVNIFVLYAVVHQVSDPVHEVAAIRTSEGNHDFFLVWVIADEAEHIEDFIFNASERFQAMVGLAWLSTLP